MNGLEQELVAVAGVNHAHVDVTEGQGATLHVELDNDADRDLVAAAVDVVLRRHGLRSRARTVAIEELEAVPTDDQDEAEPSQPVGDLAPESSVEDPSNPEPAVDEHLPTPMDATEPAIQTEEEHRSRGGIEEVHIAHRSGRNTIAVRTVDGREARASSVARQDASNQAIATAVGELTGSAVPPHLVEVRHQDVGSRRAVTVIVDLGEDIVIGTSFERGSADLGLARAVWNALTGS